MRMRARRAAVGSLVAAACLSAVACGGGGAPEVTATAQVVTVPDVTGLPYTTARGELRDLGLDVRRAEADTGQPAGTVVEQSIAPGERSVSGAPIILTVASGSSAVPVSTPAPTAAPTTPPPPSWARTFEQVSSGVVRIKADTCDFPVSGSGFLIAPDLVATNAHVVADSLAMTVDSGEQVRSGRIVGIDQDRDLALLALDQPLDGHVLQPAPAAPDVGTDVAALGYPHGLDLSLVTGTVSGLDRTVELEPPIEGAIQTDAAINPGNSGGPLLALDGTVVGVVVAVVRDAQGLAYAIPATAAFPAFRQWQDNPVEPAPTTCPIPPPGDGSETVVADTDHPDIALLLDTFQSYVTGINTGDYATAYAQWTPRLQQGTPYEQFVSAQTTSFLYDLVLSDVEPTDDGMQVDARFWSRQAPEDGPDGQTCSVWSLTYRLERHDDRWLIDGAAHDEHEPLPCE